MACAYAAAFGAIQQVPRMVPGLATVRTMPKAAQEQTVAAVQSMQELGGLAGRILLAFLAVRIVSRRRLLHIFQIPGLILLPLVLLFPATNNLTLLRYGIFLVGLLTIAQFSFWGNYLPRVYPTYLRGTGESFAANVGGRMVGTSAALITTNLVASMPGPTPAIKLAYAAAIVGTAAYAIGFIASFWMPEPKQEELPE
jgi:sugar phosphate permease